MKFGRRFDNTKIPEWADFYVSYRVLKKLLSPYKILGQYYLRSKIDNNTISVSNFSSEDVQRLDYFGEAFEKLVFQDLEKVLAFHNKKLIQIIRKWRKIRINLIIYKQRNETLTLEVKNEYHSMLREAFQALIKEVKLLTDYITVNLEAFQKILKKQKKAVSQFAPKADLKSRFDKYLLDTKVHKTRDRLNNFLYSIENEYIDFFHKNRSEGLNELRKIFQGNLISMNETFWFGLFFGFSALLILAIIILIWDEGLDIDGDKVFTKIFPIFRGIGLIIIYIWLLAWNVYVWTSYHVNYKLIFRFNYHYSQLSEILKRASAFSTVLLVLLLWYLILEGQVGKLHDLLDIVPKEIIPLFVWLCFVLYVVFPSRKIFNWPGRAYMFRLFKNMLKTPFISVNFPIIWATDQLASFVLPLKDLEYTICFYGTYFFYDDKSKTDECHSAEGLSKGVLMAAIPLVIRYLQCLRQVYDSGNLQSDPMVNSFKYLCSFIVAILSYLVSLYPTNVAVFQAWIIFAAISTIYSYYWDLKKDWGFLEPNAKYKLLRNELSYNDPRLYYTAMSVNLLMRLAWVLSISPDIISGVIRPELFALIVSFIEIFRRSVWNFLRVEKEHIANLKNFKAVPDMNLPFSSISYDLNIREDEVFSQDLKMMILNENKLGKPVCAGEQNAKMSVMMRKSSFQSTGGGDQPQTFKFIPEGDEYSNLKMLTKITSDPLMALRNRDENDTDSDLAKYKQSQTQFDVWAKEIKKFKQYVVEKANSFNIMPNYKDIRTFQSKEGKSKGLDSPREVETSISKMKKIISRNAFSVNEEAQEDEEILDHHFKNFHTVDSDISLSSYRKPSFDKREVAGNQTPLLVEMKKLSIEKAKKPHDV